MNYVVEEYTEKYGWCLYQVCHGDKDFAYECLARCRAKHPDKEFRVDVVEDKDAWWLDPFLSN